MEEWQQERDGKPLSEMCQPAGRDRAGEAHFRERNELSYQLVPDEKETDLKTAVEEEEMGDKSYLKSFSREEYLTHVGKLQRRMEGGGT